MQLCAVKSLTLLGGYSSARIAELLLPFMGEVNLGRLQKRIDRLQPQTFNKQRSVTPTAGTYAIHGVKVIVGNKQESTLFIILELHTGWLYVRLLPRIKQESLVAGLHQVFLEMVIDRAKLAKREIVLLNYKVGKTETATVIRKPVETVMNELKAGLNKCFAGVKFSKKQIDRLQDDEPLIIAGRMRRKELNSHIEELLKQYNKQQRQTFPRTKDAVCPKERLYIALETQQKEAHKPLPLTKCVCNTKTANGSCPPHRR